MSAAAQLKEPKSSVISGARRKVTSIFTDDSEMIEEFDVVTDELLLRKTRKKNKLGGESEWKIEVGSEAKAFNPDRDLLRESNSNPQLVRQDKTEAYVFRVRNLPYPKETYSVEVEEGKATGSSGEIVVRTSNKKYYKRIEIPDMNRAGIALSQQHMSWDWKHNTLIIEYKKHLSIRTKETMEKKERSSMKSIRTQDKEGCAQQ